MKFDAERAVTGHPPLDNPFELTASAAYEAWRQVRLANYPADVDRLLIRLQNPYALQASELHAIVERCDRYNMALYELEDGSLSEKSLVHALGEQLGLRRLDSNLRADEDSVTSLKVNPQRGNQYIPYTNRPLSWHTDGYYNAAERQIRAIIMHCVSPAVEGGDNALLDHEMMYIRLRDENPAWIEALMHPSAMTIPANIEMGETLRDACTGPVFSVDPRSGRLHMRYSARKRNIEWRDDVMTQQAAARISALLEDESSVFRHKLRAGQGIISNNVLHNRTGFSDTDEQQRLVYRARYYDRVQGATPKTDGD